MDIAMIVADTMEIILRAVYTKEQATLVDIFLIEEAEVQIIQPESVGPGISLH